jgi:hypothetical protein
MNWKNQVILVTARTELFSKALLQFMFLLFGENRQYPLIVDDKP